MPAEGELAKEVGSLHALSPRQAHRGKEERADDETRRVDHDCPTRPDAGDEESRRRRAAHVGEVQGEAQQRVRLLQMRGRDRLRDEASRSREEEGGGCAPDRLKHDQVPNLGTA